MSEDGPSRGERRRRVLFGTEAVYRVLAREGDLVRVEVERAPGIAVGAVLRLTADAVRQMELLDSPGDGGTPSPGRAS
jgi:hypothetical protein